MFSSSGTLTEEKIEKNEKLCLMGNQIGNLMLENPIQCQKGGGGWEGGDRKSARDRRSHVNST